jgi:Tfp pilus assembly PilM family ATPase
MEREGRNVARYLALDWDYEQLRIVAATVRAGQVRIEQAAVWQEKQSPNPADAEAVGRQLRERLKEAGITPAPVLACVGRDRVILREVRYPAVAAAEEAGVIRFQVLKELTDSAQEVIIDYTPMGEVGPGEERRAMVLTARRELLATYQTLCRSAGVKLAALTPRPFGTLACLRVYLKNEEDKGTFSESHKDGSAQVAVALLTAAGRWSEFCLVRGDTLLVARSLPEGPTLAAEVRRNLAVYTAQSPRHVVSRLYLAGNGDTGTHPERLQETLGIPVRCFDPFMGPAGAVLPEQNRGAFAGAIGLLHSQSNGKPLAINFASPKEPQVARNPNKRRLAVAAGMAALLLVGAVSYCYSQLATLDSQIDALTVQKSQLSTQMPLIEEEEDHLKELNEWSRSNVCWLDELYNLTALVPTTNTLRLYEIKGDTQPQPKDKPVAQMELKLMTRDAGDIVFAYLDKMAADKHYVPHTHRRSGDLAKDPTFSGQFTALVEVENQPPEKYQQHLTATLAPQLPSRRARTQLVNEANPPGLAKPERGSRVISRQLPTDTGPRPNMAGQNYPAQPPPGAGLPATPVMDEIKAQGVQNPPASAPVQPADLERMRQERREKAIQRLRDSGRTAPATAPAKEKGKS